MKISVVTSLYNSDRYIVDLYNRIKRTAEKIADDFEIIFVNDASPDDSLITALGLIRPNSHLKVIDLSRNFGQHKAILTGLRYATGDLVFMMDSDLEEHPEWIETFFLAYRNSVEEVDVIYGVQEIRRGNLFEKWWGVVFYKLFNILSSIKVEKNPTPFRLMTKRYVEAIIEFKEHEVFFLGISILTGFNQKSLIVNKNSSSTSSYNIFRRLDQFVNAITSFSKRPLTCVFYIGALISVVTLLYIVYIIIQYYFFQIGIAGWTSLIVSIWLVGGIVIFCLGLIGIYLSKIFIEVKNRPYTIIKKIYE